MLRQMTAASWASAWSDALCMPDWHLLHHNKAEVFWDYQSFHLRQLKSAWSRQERNGAGLLLWWPEWCCCAELCLHTEREREAWIWITFGTIALMASGISLKWGAFLKITGSLTTLLQVILYIEFCTKSLAVNPIPPVIHGKYMENLRFEILVLLQSRCNEALFRLQTFEDLQYTFLQLTYSCLSYALSSLHKT